METSFWTIILLFFLLSSIWTSSRRSRRRGLLPPGPPSWPIIGNMHNLAGGAPHMSLAKLAEIYGPLMFIWLGSKPTVVVSSPELAKEFLFTHDKVFASRPHFGCAARLKAGQDSGLALARYGRSWSEMRKLSHSQLFAASRVRELQPIIMDEIRTMLTDVERHATTGLSYNITKGTTLLLENIICRVLMSKRLDEVGDVKSGFSLREVLEEGIALYSTRPMVSDFVPWLGFLDILHVRRIDAWIASMHAVLHNVVALRCPSHSPTDFLDALLLAGKGLESIKVVLVDFLCGGIDTPSVTLDWAMAELLQSTESMRKLERELETKVGKSRRMVQEEDLPNLVYAKAVVKETLRLHTPIPLLVPHMSTEDSQVAGYTLPKGTRVLVNVWTISRDPRVWSDRAAEFYPDRFLDKNSRMDVRGNDFELLPFGSGRRCCPGISLSLPILELALANLIHHFQWSLPPDIHVLDMSEKFGSVLCRASHLVAVPSVRS